MKKIFIFLFFVITLNLFTVNSAHAENSGDFDIQNGILCHYSGSGGDVVIPDSVTFIQSYAFYCCDGLTSITIPASVEDIYPGAFYNCLDLTSVTFLGSPAIWFSGYGAFKNCGSPIQVYAPSSLHEALYCDFQGSDVCYLWFDNETFVGYEVTVFGEYGRSIYSEYYHKVYAVNAVIPNFITSIGSHAFSGCPVIASITIPNSVTYIGDYAFSGCASLTSVDIPASVTYIGRGAFSGTPWLASQGEWVIINGQLIAYQGCDAPVTIPTSVTSIGNGAFYRCDNLASFTIPNSVVSIGDYAFEECYNLNKLIIPTSVTHIGRNSIPGETRVIYTGTQEELNSIEIDAENSFKIHLIFEISDTGELTRYNGDESKVIVPDNVTSIGDAACKCYSNT